MTDVSTDPALLEVCFRYLILGIIQGVTEFLPISSTAHLKILPMFFGWGDPGISVSAAIQLGSIFAVIGYFRKDLKKVFFGITNAMRKAQWREKNARLGISIALGTIPIFITGLAIKVFWPNFENSSLRSSTSIALTSVLMALVLAYAEKKAKQIKHLANVSGKDGFMIGLAQVLALIPGVSRSGITLTAALINGWERNDAARFSFLLGIPAITIAGIVEIKGALNSNFNAELLPLFIGVLSAFIVSWLSIDWLLKYLQRHSTWIFVGYRLLFGFCLLALWS